MNWMSLKLNTMQLETPGGMATTAVLWQMVYRIKDWFIHLLILSTVYEHDQQKTNILIRPVQDGRK